MINVRIHFRARAEEHFGHLVLLDAKYTRRMYLCPCGNRIVKHTFRQWSDYYCACQQDKPATERDGGGPFSKYKSWLLQELWLIKYRLSPSARLFA